MKGLKSEFSSRLEKDEGTSKVKSLVDAALDKIEDQRDAIYVEGSGTTRNTAGSNYIFEIAQTLNNLTKDFRECRGQDQFAKEDALHIIGLASEVHGILSEAQSSDEFDFSVSSSAKHLEFSIGAAMLDNRILTATALKALPTYTQDQIRSGVEKLGYSVSDDFMKDMNEKAAVGRAYMDMYDHTPS